MDTSQLIEAGLYDPTADDAEERLALLAYLSERGATVEQLVQSAHDERLPALAADLVLFPRRTLTAEQAAARLGWSVDKLSRVHLAMGLPMDEDQGVADDMVTALEIFDVGASLFGEQSLLQFSRVLGASAARIAESALSLFLSEIEQPLDSTSSDDGLRLARANGSASEALRLVPQVISSLLPEHIEQAIRRQRADPCAPVGDQDRRHLTVGFVDLVAFTELSGRLSPAELADVLGRFESLAWDAVVSNDARVVKMIGDEVMFVATDASSACAAAVEICERVGAEPSLGMARAGLASGEVSAWGADVFGPVVNLASRLTKQLPGGHVAATSSVRDQVAAGSGRWAFRSMGAHHLKGFDDPVPLLEVVSAQR